MSRTRAVLVPLLATLLAGCPWDNNDPASSVPSAANDAATLVEFSTAVIDLAANDSDTGGSLDLGSIEIVTTPVHGALVLGADGTATYTHDGTPAPDDSFTYTIRNSAGRASSPATVALTITPFPAATTGLKTILSGGVDRDYYLDLPSDYDPHGPLKPLIIAYHGTGGSYARWLDYYRLREVVGDGAILLYPDARPNAAGIKQWNFAADFGVFEDLLEQLPAGVRFDPNRLFVTGHSSGGGFTHELGCRYGDRIRAIAPDAGSLTTSTCVGSVAVLQIQGARDSYVPAGIGGIAHRFWVLYNGFEPTVSGSGVVPECIDHSLGASDYPVQWCLHQEGADGPSAHAWPSFANTAIWTFFRDLQPVTPTADPPPGGGNQRAAGNATTTLSFTLRYPAGMGTPIQVAAVLRPGGTVPPVSTAPMAFLNLNFFPSAGPGDDHSYVIPIRFQDSGLVDDPLTFPGTYTINFVIYVEGGSFPIPAAGVDYTVYVDADLVDRHTPIVIPGVLTLEPVTP